MDDFITCSTPLFHDNTIEKCQLMELEVTSGKGFHPMYRELKYRKINISRFIIL